MSLKNDTVEINSTTSQIRMPDGMIIGHVVGPNLVWVTDPDFAARPDQPLAQHDGGW